MRGELSRWGDDKGQNGPTGPASLSPPPWPLLGTGGATTRLVLGLPRTPSRLNICALQARAMHPTRGPFWAQTALLGPNLPRATCGGG